MGNAGQILGEISDQRYRRNSSAALIVPTVPLCTPIKDWPADGGKALLAGDDHIVGAKGTVDNQNIAALVPATDNPDMGILRVKDQITDLGLRPGDAGTVAVLRHSAAAMANDVLSVRGVVEHPVHEPGAVQAVGPVGACGAVPCRCNLCEPPPAAVPAQDEAFNSDR